jgi:uncharacterized membrane protein YphA (DoxX/SURF4 family)
MNTFQKYAPTLLRIGMAIVILWFGFQQLTDALSWVGFLPEWTTRLPLNQVGLVMINGWFEIIFGLMLLLGFYTRFTALFIALHLLEITWTVGYGGIGARDFGLTLAMISISMNGASPLSVDYLLSE